MTADDYKEALEVLQKLGLTPLDWLDASQFSSLTGINESKLPHRKKNWPEDLVWTKQDGNVYYSLKGYNQWLTEQARKRYLKACGLETGQSKSILHASKNRTTSPSRTPQLRKVSRQLLRLEAT